MSTLKENFYKNRGLAVNPLLEGFGDDGDVAQDFDPTFMSSKQGNKIDKIVQAINDAHSKNVRVAIYFGGKWSGWNDAHEMATVLPKLKREIAEMGMSSKNDKVVIEIGSQKGYSSPESSVDFKISVPMLAEILSKIDVSIVPKKTIDIVASELSGYIDWGAGFKSFGQFASDYSKDSYIKDTIKKIAGDKFKSMDGDELFFELLYKVWNAKKGIGKLPKNQ